MTKRIPQIEVLRVLAMAGVFFFHSGPWFPSRTHNPLGPLLGDILAQGYLGRGRVQRHLRLRPDPALAARAADWTFRRPFSAAARPHLPPVLHGPGPVERRRLFSASAGSPPLWRAFAEHPLFVPHPGPGLLLRHRAGPVVDGLLAQFYLFYPLVLRFFPLGPGRAMLG
jgi:hypothetical protein